MDREKLRKKIREFDTKRWKEGMKKSTLYIYREAKERMGYDDCYNNSY